MFDKTKQNNAWRDVCVYLSRTFVAQRFNLAKPFLSLFYFYENATTTHEATTNGVGGHTIAAAPSRHLELSNSARNNLVLGDERHARRAARRRRRSSR